MKKNKILMLLDNSFHSDARVEKEMKKLFETGFQVNLIAYKDDKLNIHEDKKYCSVKRILDKSIENPLRKEYYKNLNHFIKEIMKFDFDIIYCHDFYLIHLASELKKLKPKSKLIYDAHEYLRGWPFFLDNKGIFNKFKGFLVWKKLILNEKKYIKWADLIISITNPILRKLGENNQHAIKAVIGNYPEKHISKGQKNYFNLKFKILKKTKIIVHSGSIYYSQKELTKLFEVIRQKENIALVFLCNRPYISDIKNTVNSDLILKRKIFFHDYINDKNQLINILSTADIGLMYLKLEWVAHKVGFSNKFMEYIQAGLPVLATPQEFTKDVNKEFRNCVFYNRKINSFSKALTELINNYDDYKKRSQQIINKYLWENESKKLISNIKSLFENEC